MTTLSGALTENDRCVLWGQQGGDEAGRGRGGKMCPGRVFGAQEGVLFCCGLWPSLVANGTSNVVARVAFLLLRQSGSWDRGGRKGERGALVGVERPGKSL
jgi:hypothetical protein